jgi:hypothetical protein
MASMPLMRIIIGTDAILGEGVIVKRSISHTGMALVV